MNLKKAVLLGLLFMPLFAMASNEEEPRTVSGISIIGNNEAPKSLFIVPWKSSGPGEESEFSSALLSDALVPVDRDVFMRELRFYELSNR